VYYVSWPKFETDTSRIKLRSFTDWASLLDNIATCIIRLQPVPSTASAILNSSVYLLLIASRIGAGLCFHEQLFCILFHSCQQQIKNAEISVK
jgi:hypothetical protein